MLSVNYSDEAGSAVLEFIGFGLLLQLPLVLVTNSLVMAQHDQLTAEAITRDVLRSHVLMDKDPARTSLELADAYGVASNRVKVTVVCRPSNCQQEKSWVNVTTQIGDVRASGVIQR